MVAENTPHKQIMIKVNAECDEGIVPIVLALNEINGVVTLDSCQCGVYGEAFVHFTYGKNWQEIGYLVNELASCFRDNGVCCEGVLRLEWLGNNDCPHAKLVCNAGHIGSIADIIATSAAKINDRMSELIHGKGYIGLHN